MTVGADALTAAGNPEYGFCSNRCLEAFTANPDRYTEQATGDDSDGEADPDSARAPTENPVHHHDVSGPHGPQSLI